MASIKNLKKDLNYIFSDIIEDCYVWQLANGENADKAEPVIDDAIAAFDTLIEKVNNKKVEDKKSHFKSIVEELKGSVATLHEKIGKL